MSTKIKVKSVKKVTGDVNLGGMFDEMLGVTDAEPSIVAPKFVQARNMIRRLTKVLAQFGIMPTLRRNHPAIIPHLDEIKTFSDKTREELHIKTDPDEPLNHFDSLNKEEINRVYRKLKENPATKRLVIMCNRLEKYKVNFENPEKIRENFVNAEPGLDFKIFDFSNLDLKYLWGVCDIPSSAKKYILALFADLYKHSHALYNLITSPDVDIKAFTATLISSLGDLRKQPKLSRCNRAFKRIEMSVDLLNEKFSDYYRESIITQNPDTLVGNFIYDVSQQGKDDPKLMREFKTIINYMEELSRTNGKANDPKVKQIFAMLQNNFNLMEKVNKQSTDKPLDEEVNMANEEAANQAAQQFMHQTMQQENGAEEPASEEPASEEPASEEPASEEPASEEPASEEPASENDDVVDDMPELLDMQQLKQLSEQYIANLTLEQTPDTALLNEDLDQ
jgi:hypothetical protein